MIALYIVGGILLLLFLLSLIRVGVFVEYSADGLVLKALAGWFRFAVFPGPELTPDQKARREVKKAARKQKKAGKKAAKAEKEERSEQKKGGALDKLRQALPPLIKALKRLRRRLVIHELILHYTAASDDAFQTAVTFGRVSAGMGGLVPLLENSFEIRKRSLTASADFLTDKPTVYLRARMTWRILELLWIAGAFACGFLKNSDNANKTTGKVE